MRMLLLCVLSFVVSNQWTHAGDNNPKSKRSRWRIPANAAVTAVGVQLNWSYRELADGRLMLQSALGKHHTYEQAWAYYASIFGLNPDYGENTKQQETVFDGDKRTLSEHDRDHIFRAGRWARMHGKFGNYETSVSLWDDPGLAEKMGKAYRVPVTIIFHPQ